MATLTLTFDTGSITLNDLNDMLALEYGYQATIDGSPNPLTKAQHNRRHIGRSIKDAYNRQKTLAAEAEARNNVVLAPEFT